jgi:predicted GH43/DUF377 family glycosyl hydrolase
MATKDKHISSVKKTSAKRKAVTVDSLHSSRRSGLSSKIADARKKIPKKVLVEKIFIGKQVVDIKGAIKKSKIKIKSVEAQAAPYRKPLAIGRYAQGYYLLLRETADDGKHTLYSIVSSDGEKFTNQPDKVNLCHRDSGHEGSKHMPGKEEDLSKCRDFRFFSGDNNEMTLTYTRRESATESCLVYAASKDHKTWIIGGEIKKIHTNGVLVPELKEGAGDAIYFGGDMLRVAFSKNSKSWNIVEPHRVPHWHFFDGAAFRVIGAVPIEKLGTHSATVHATLTHDAIALFYESEMAVDILADVNLRNEKVGEERFIKVGVALFAQDMPTRLLWQTELPLIEFPLEKIAGFSIIGVVHSDKKEYKLRIYGADQNGAVSFIEFSERVLADHRERRPAVLAKHPNNPIISPHQDHVWEAEGAFNPAALNLDGGIHLLYRAVGSDGLSRIGYASSKDGVTISDRLPEPVFRLDMNPEVAAQVASQKKEDADHGSFGPMYSGGSWGGGSEDPKVTRVGDRIYMTYVAHHGWWPMRTALTSISVKDFLAKRWKWTKPVLMSPPNVGSKSVVLMPEKIHDKYVIFHRMWPNIVMDTVPDLEFGDEWKDAQGRKHGGRWLTGQHRILPRRSFWDSQKLSMGSTPIKTPEGWLAIYNAVDRRDSSKYQIGAMLLDLHEPHKVIARGRKPILAPTEWYENEGKPGIAYPGGAVDLDGILHVYYGGGDKVSCVATIPTDNLVWHLLRDADPRVVVRPVSFEK